MNIRKNLIFGTVLLGFFAFVPISFASADSGRYFVKSTKSFWKNALGVRHSFENGFTTDLSDFQVRLNRILGLDVEPVKTFQILPASGEVLTTITPLPSDTSTASNSPEPSKTPIAKPKTSVRPLPSDQTPWGIETIYNDPLVTKTSGGDNVKVAVLDTGADVSHPDLKNRVIICEDLTNPKLSAIDGKCEDKNGHGTDVAGIVAADGGDDGIGIYGVAPASKLLIYKVCSTDGICYADDVAAAIRMAADDGANIINMSFGNDSGISLVNDAINYAVSKGVLPVAAAGNDGPLDASINYPAAYPSVIGVGAINQLLLVTEWSSRGVNASSTSYDIGEKDIEFAAPGENIESTYNNGGYVILSGTSMASPFVAGLAAKYWQSSFDNPAQATRDYLHTLAADLPQSGNDSGSGFGLPRVSVPINEITE